MVTTLEESRVLVVAANRRVEVDRVDRAIDILKGCLVGGSGFFWSKASRYMCLDCVI
jgi:hypothetical protein